MRLKTLVLVRSTRTRVLGWFLLIVAVALGVNLVAVEESLQARARAAVAAELEHEVVKFREYAKTAVDETTGRPFSSARELLKKYLTHAVPEADEALFSVVDGQAGHRTRNPVPIRLDQRPDVVATASAATEPLIRTVQTADGDAVYAVVPVKTETKSPKAALVIVQYTARSMAEVASIVRLLAVASIAALALAAVISWFVAGRILAPLRQVRRTAETISESDLTQRIDIAPDARDDVARLAHTFNGMLDRLESAFRTQRAFLDDAAHELRTPLTVIRGHLELMGDDPAERIETTALLLDEIVGMNRLVDDLLVLAAAERPDFLNVGDVDLTDLVVGVVARASALAPRRWRIASTTETIVLADRQRLTQALMQLVSNAVRFTEDDDRLSLGSYLEDGWVVLTVADTGRGVPAELKESIFMRFHRGSRSGGESTGLGLAIVRSIAEAHRGEATVTDTPGGGATFSVRFPARWRPTGRRSGADDEGAAAGSGPEPEPEAERQAAARGERV
ncbi:MAG: HAMP domain-containing histidine kinase [Microlunatus sp.]|nr:HAMP domain-containing histidine kinase [Microlunatus sp.]MDN5769470.1 HAMP domain-containing histidine kinase [Microlunatus sp.]